MHTQDSLQELIRKHITPKKALVKRRGRGMLKYDYLVPGGVYEEQWDWDAFFIGMALTAAIPSEAIFLKNWALNYIENSSEDGFSPGLVTPNGPDNRLNQMKPFLAQGSYFACVNLQDTQWLQKGNTYDQLKKIVLYRENVGFFNTELNLGAWTNSMESGADNNVAVLPFPDKSVAAVDFNSFLYLEYLAMQKLASLVGKNDDIAFFQEKAEKLKQAILEHLWCEEDGTFYNVNLQNKQFIKVVGYSSVHPFWAGIASQAQADAFFQRYVLHPEKLLSPHGVRSLSKDHPEYNNVNMIKPHSNWQGPIWPIANYIFIQSLLRYGYQNDARTIAQKVIGLCIADIEANGGMHENYDAETGLPLAAPNFISWNLLLEDVLKQIEEKRNPFEIA
jgi:alpha,alpha-trehalase